MVRSMRVKTAALRCSTALLVLAFIAGCSSNDDDSEMNMDPTGNEDPLVGLQAIFASRDSLFESGLIERISISGGDVYQSELQNGALSDISIATDGEFFYQLGKTGADSVTKYDPADTSAPVFQFSVAGEEVSANPYDMIFVSDTKAYLLRYDSPKIWIVDPSATVEESFKIGEIDLAAYDDLDGIPEISGGVLVGNKLFVLMERLERGGFPWKVEREGYLAVIDTGNDAEINTEVDTVGGLSGIPLGVQNPTAISYADDGFIYLVGRGNNFGAADSEADRYTGGLVAVNPDNYAADLLVDDKDEATNDGLGFFYNYVPVSATKGYLQTYNAWQSTNVYTVNPMTRALTTEAVAGLEATDVTTLAMDPNDRLWVGISTETGGEFAIVDSSTDERTKTVATTFVPIKVVFIDVAE